MDSVNAWVDVDEVMRLAETLLVTPVNISPPPTDAGFGGEFIGFAPEKTTTYPTETLTLPQLLPPTPPSPPQLAPVVPDSPTSATTPAPTIITTTPPILSDHSQPRPQPFTILSPKELHVTPVVPTTPVVTATPLVAVTPIAPAAPAAQATTPIENTPQKPFLERILHFSQLLREHLSTKGFFMLDKVGTVIFDDADHTKLYFMARSLANSTRNTKDGLHNVQIRVGSTISLLVLPTETVYGKVILGILTENTLPTEVMGNVISVLQNAIAPHKNA